MTTFSALTEYDDVDPLVKTLKTEEQVVEKSAAAEWLGIDEGYDFIGLRRPLRVGLPL